MKAKIAALLALLFFSLSLAGTTLAAAIEQWSSDTKVNDGAIGLQRGNIVTKTSTFDSIG